MEYPSNYFGPIGIVHCTECGAELDLDNDVLEETEDGYICLDCFMEMDDD